MATNALRAFGFSDKIQISLSVERAGMNESTLAANGKWRKKIIPKHLDTRMELFEFMSNSAGPCSVLHPSLLPYQP